MFLRNNNEFKNSFRNLKVSWSQDCRVSGVISFLVSKYKVFKVSKFQSTENARFQGF
jgi:hypothetical protein